MKTIKALLALMMLLIPVCAAAQEARRADRGLRHHLWPCPHDVRARQRLYDGVAQ